MTAEKPQQGFWLADWWVKPDLSELERDGTVIQLEPKVMAVLETLASNPGKVFSRQELEDIVWQGTVIGYDALSKAINKLRDALGDDKKNPLFIQTISKKGYRLVAKVSTEVRSTETAIPTETTVTGNLDAPESGKNLSATNRNRLVIGVVLAVLLLAGLAMLFKSGNNIEQTPITQATPAHDYKPTIVVLPFRNISPSDKDDYLADGLTSDLTTSLSKLSGLWVTASTATLIYKNTDVTPEKIKKEFNARYVISGEVSKVTQSIRINVLLTDLKNGNILWAERYDRQFTDLFAIQDEVTEKILDNLSLTLTTEERRRIAKRYTNNLEAYEIFLRAQYLLSTRTPKDNRTAREMYKKAIVLDPGFARAYAGLSYSYSISYLRQWPSDTDRPLDKALQLANQALELDKDLPESYWVASFVYFYRTNLDKGFEQLNKALVLNPNYADAYAMMAALNISSGNPELALNNMKNAYRLNPTGGYLYDMQLGRANYFLNNYDLALEYLTSALQRNPTYIDNQMYSAATYIQLQRYEEAGWMILEAKQTNPDFDPHTWATAYPFLDNKGYRAKLLKDLDQAEAYSN